MDVDDVGAITTALALMDKGEAELLATVVNTKPHKCPGVVSVLHHFYGRDNISIGSYKGTDLPDNSPHHYVDNLVDNWEAPVKTADQVPSALSVYRKVLSAQPDSS